jgi:OmpA-OmpF porin, OOP family
MGMRVLLALSVLFLSTQTSAQEKDVEGGHDHPLLTRMPGFFLERYEVKDFDTYESPYAPSVDSKWEGKSTYLHYTIKTGTKSVSMAQIAKNYEVALKQIGGKILGGSGRAVAAKLEKAGTKTWVQVDALNDGTAYELYIVEAKAMEQEVFADATAMKAGLSAEGKIALYGIYFDTNKAVVKPESNPALEQIVKLLKQNAGLKLFVVGHTDGVGTPESNQKLSSDRAAAVVKSLVGLGVDATLLKPVGVGPYSPVATNKTDAGKAKNRRVELVERL